MLKYTGEKPKTPEELERERLQAKVDDLETETALLWYELMTVGGASNDVVSANQRVLR